MLSLLYVSAAARALLDAEVVDLLRRMRSDNVQEEITGMLLHRDGTFLQVLEGPEPSVLKAYHKILDDPRHTRVTTLLQEPVDERRFEDWPMGYLNADVLDEADRQFVSPALNEPFRSERFVREPQEALDILLSFKECMAGVSSP